MKTILRTLLVVCGFVLTMLSTNASAVVPTEDVTANCNGTIRHFNNYVLVPASCKIMSVVKTCPTGYNLVGSTCQIKTNPIVVTPTKKTSIPNCPPGYRYMGVGATGCTATKVANRCPAGGYSASATTCNAQASCPAGMSIKGSVCSN